jgi:hypothetical protein
MKKITTVDWFAQQLARIGVTDELIGHLITEAKQMEREQVESAYNQGKKDGHSIGLFYDEPELATNHFENSEQYYNEKYDKKN